MSEILLSICIPTYNRADVVYECVNHCLQVSSGCDFIEVVVTDNCSTDNTEERLRTICDERFHYYRNTKNLGLANIGHCLTRGGGKFCMYFSDKDEIERVDWGLLKGQLEDSKSIVMFQAQYKSEKGEILVNPSDEIYQKKQVDTYLYLRNACKYATALMIKRDILMECWEDIDKTLYLWSEYPQSLIAIYCAQFGDYTAIHGLTTKQNPYRMRTRLLHVAAWNGTIDEPYWTIKARLLQDLDYVDVYRHIALDSEESRERLLRVLVYWNLGELANYCDYIYFSSEIKKNYLYIIGDKFVKSDRAKTLAQWSELFWDNYAKLNQKIGIDVNYDMAIINRKYRRLRRIVIFSKLGFVGGILLHFPAYIQKIKKVMKAIFVKK